MYKKFLFFFLGIIVGIFGISQIQAISHWTQSNFGEHWGIWSTTKNSTDILPTFAIGKDGRVAVNPKNTNTLSSNDFRAGDIIADRFCFENSKECVTTFKQDLANNRNFSFSVNGNLASNVDGTIPYNGHASNMPFVLKINENFINTVGLSDERTTNWIDIGQGSMQAYITTPKSIWMEEGSNFEARITRSYNGEYIVQGNEKLAYCEIKDPNTGIVQHRYTTTQCQNNSHIFRTNVCNTDSNTCGRLRAEVRFTSRAPECEENNFGQILAVGAWGNVNISNFYSTPYKSPDNPTYSPIYCGTNNFGSKMQIRFKLANYSETPSQSLREHIKVFPRTMRITRFGISLLQ